MTILVLLLTIIFLINPLVSFFKSHKLIETILIDIDLKYEHVKYVTYTFNSLHTF